MVDERLLQRVQHAIIREPLDRGHLVPLVLDGQSHARQDPLPSTSTVQAPHAPWLHPFFVP
jgi:BarA-like signal transduction histidine kinase